MFRFLTALFVAIFLIDLAVNILQTRRAPVIGSLVLGRKSSPIGYWLMTLLWSLVAIGSAVGVVFLSYLALTSSGPYERHAFFSFYQAWPYAVTTVLFGWLIVTITIRRLNEFKNHRSAA